MLYGSFHTCSGQARLGHGGLAHRQSVGKSRRPTDRSKITDIATGVWLNMVMDVAMYAPSLMVAHSRLFAQLAVTP